MPLFNKTRRQIKGDTAEAQALKFLCAKGLKLLQSNYHCRWGEIDLIVEDSGTLVFVEVRYRNSRRFGGAAASVTPAKQKRIIKTASHYLCQLDTEPDCRFDVISVQGELRSPAINWIKNAFYS